MSASDSRSSSTDSASPSPATSPADAADSGSSTSSQGVTLPRTHVVDALNGSAGSRVKVQGWVRTRRDSKAGLSFINVNDGTCFDNIQIVAPNSLPNYEGTVLSLTTGCSVTAIGELVESKGKGQALEIQAESIDLVGDVEDPDTYPVSAKRHTFEYLRSVAHLRPRTNTFGAIARVRHCLSHAVHDFYHQRKFLYVHTPIVSASDAEGAGEMFRVSTLDLLNLPVGENGQVDFDQDFFGREAFLTVSGQINVEAYCCALSNVYTFGPTFRAENSNTSRHLSEFWMIEPEIAFADLNEDIDLAVDFIRYLIRTLLTERADDMKFFDDRIEKGIIDSLEGVAEAEFLRITYTEAIEELKKAKKKFEYPVEWGLDLQSEHERYLTEERFRKPVVVTDYPREIKAFYMRLNDDEKTVAAMDVLAPRIGEIIGGSQREERLDVLDRRIEEMGLEKEHYWWYRDLRRYGTVPHAGFGLGFDRFVQYVTGMGNIRDVIPFPRAPRTCEF
ncbi:MAG: asparagine--tRNA ligase [Planctomycetota bacterium]